MKPDEEENMSAGEKLEHILATILLMFVAILMVGTCSKAMATETDHGHSTDYIVINKENDSGKYVIGTAILLGAIYCLVKKCWDESPSPDPLPNPGPAVKEEVRVTPGNLSDGVRVYQ